MMAHQDMASLVKQRQRKRPTNYNWSGKKKKRTAMTPPRTGTNVVDVAPPETTKNHMTPEELREWTKWYKTPATLEKYLRNMADDPHGLLEDLYGQLAELMYHEFDGVDEFYEVCYEELYCWVQELPASGIEFDFENGSQLHLKIRTQNHQGKSDPFEKYIYIAKSAYGGLGVFTARAFPKGALLGLYLGPTEWTADTIGTEAPSDDFIERLGVADTVCLVSIRDKHGRMGLYNPTRVPPGDDPKALYMGMQYIKGVEEKGIPRSKANCELIEDGGVVTHFALPAETELICGVLE